MAKRTRKFKTEVQQLLDLVVHSLYSKKEIFLRELISNASDAIDRARFEALTEKELLEDDHEGRIRISVDKEARTLTVSDNGIGMSVEEVEKNVGTIANSGTKAFLEKLQESKNGADAEFIGQFGVGFYASFMVADKVSLVTRRAGKGSDAIQWTSAGAGNYTLEEAERDGHGTDVTLHLREDMEEHLEEWRIRQTVKQYSDYIAYPVMMDITRTEPAEKEGDEPTEVTEEETLNSMKAIWRKDKKEVSKDEYLEFYKHVSHDYTEPLETIHFAAEGATEFRALLYIPSQAPFDLFIPDRHHGLQLYVKNVFITDDCKELIPEYLRFVSGVVDSSDLPLNVSREILQDDAIIRRIHASVVTKVLNALTDMQKKRGDDYLKCFAQFGKVLKEGVHQDHANRDKLKELLLYPSTSTEADHPVSLREYVDRMPQDQKEIYYLSAESREAAEHSPLLEAFTSRSYEVLFFLDPIDEWVSQSLTEYDGKSLKAIDRGDVDLDSEGEKEQKDEAREQARQEHDDLLKFIQEKLDEDIKEVRLSNRLTDSPCCLVSDENAMNATMERMMRSMGQDVPVTKRILELNPGHALMKRMKGLHDADPKDEKLAGYVDIVYGEALLLEGSPVKQPQRFVKLVSELMVGDGDSE